MRLDLYLRICRLVKRRTVARELCEAGRALVNGREAKPGKELKPGDRITLIFSAKRVELEVLTIPSARSARKPDVADLYRVLSETRQEREDIEWKEDPLSS